MGPQLCSCGNSSSSRTSTRTERWLQWGRNFAVAETLITARHYDMLTPASMGPQLCSCGNLADTTEGRTARLASMGPQLCSCGNLEREGIKLTDERFNGAATLQLRKRVSRRPAFRRPGLLQWGRNFAVAETRIIHRVDQLLSERFNGAATLQLRKHDARIDRCYDYGGLQWGRNFAVAETWYLMAYAYTMIPASMGPQLCSCGNGEWEKANVSGKCRFNGAATLQLRKLPQYGHAGIAPLQLQWGRNFAVAETIPSRGRLHTSFRGLQWGRNFAVAET